MIQPYIISGQLSEAINQVQRMRDKGVEPTQYTYMVLLSASANDSNNSLSNIVNLDHGLQIHQQLEVIIHGVRKD